MVVEILQLMKNYVDAKIEYEMHVPHSNLALSASVSLTESARKIQDRYFIAEEELNAAIRRSTKPQSGKQSMTTLPPHML